MVNVKRIVVPLILLVLLSVLFGTFAPIQADGINLEDNPTLKPENLLLLEVHLGGLELRDEFLTCYRHDGVVLIPMGQLASFLELPLEVTPEAGLIEGFIWEEEEEYGLDVPSGVARVNEEDFPVEEHRVVVNWEDVYIDTELLSEWLPMDVEIDPYSAVVELRPDKPLPLQERMERRYRWERLSDRRSVSDGPIYPPVENPYTFFSGPFIDHRISFSYIPGESPSLRHRAVLSGDLLNMSGRFSLSGSLDNPLAGISGRLGRRSPDPNLLGPFNAHQFWFGDVNQPSVSDITSMESVRGANLSSFPYIRPTYFRRHTFEGELPEGWEVELYENNTLIDYQRSNEEEEYVFEDVPLDYGVNDFTLVFYDEFGQKQEESKTYRIDSSLIPPGEDSYRFDVGVDRDNETRGLVKYGRGLTDNLTLMTDYVRTPGSSGHYAKLGLRSSLDGVFLQGDYLQELGGGHGGEVGLHTDLLDTRISLKHARFDDYTSEETSNVKRRTGLEMNRTFSLPAGNSLSARLDIVRKEDIDGEVTAEIDNRFSTHYRGVSFRNDLNFRFREDGQIDGSGEFRARARLDDYRWAGRVGYDIESVNLRNASTSFRGPIDDVHRFNLGISRNLEEDTNTYSAGISRDKDYYRLGLNTSYREDGDLRLGLELSISYGRDDRDDSLQPGASARHGAASVKTYIDDGNDNEPVEGVGFRVNDRSTEPRTDETGIAFIDGLSPDRKTDIAIDPGTVEDPFLVADPEGVSFIPRAGQAFELELPVVMTSELDGNVYLRREEGVVGLRSLEMQLVDEAGEVVESATTAFDGYFYMSRIRPGDYRLRVAPEAAKRRGLTQPGAKEIHIPQQGGHIGGFEFILERID